MNKLEIIKGDLIKLAFQGEAKIIVHGCNCFHAMGSGIAGQLARTFPEIPEADAKTPLACTSKLAKYSRVLVTERLLGTPVDPDRTVPVEHQFTCVNLYTQFRPGADFIPSLFPEALKRLNTEFKGDTLWFPMIGCGIGGGDWAIVMSDMLRFLPDLDVKVVVL